MRIKSHFKDYYDFISYQYGGGDPKVVYVRTRFKQAAKNSSTFMLDLSSDNKDLPYILRDLPSFGKFHNPYWFKWLVITGKLYLLVADATHSTGIMFSDYTVLDIKLHSELCLSLFKISYYGTKNYSHYMGVEQPTLIEISRSINAPVFVINGTLYNFHTKSWSISISRDIPVLAKLGIPPLIDPFTMYQDIAYFIGNTMNVSPDVAPPVQVSDKDRLLQHGFDAKQSFRHRL